MTQYRIKEKNKQFYPQEKGWRSAWIWQNFGRPANEQYPNITSDTYVDTWFKTLDEAKVYIEKIKDKRQVTIHHITKY